MKEKMDRRVRVTRQVIRDSFIELTQKHPLQKISVKMICDAADINRSTFYAHYADQYDLLAALQKEVIADLQEYISKQAFTERSELTVQVLTRVLEYARDNKELFNVLLSGDVDAEFQQKIMFLAQEKTIIEIRADQEIDRWISENLQLFAVTGCVSMIRNWLAGGTKASPGQMANLITKLLFEGISGFYR